MSRDGVVSCTVASTCSARSTRPASRRAVAAWTSPPRSCPTSCWPSCPEELAVLADDDLLPTGEETDDIARLSDDELRERIHELSESEREVSFKRRILHGQIDLLRAEIIARLRERDGEASEHLAASDVEKLSAILSHRGPPLELPAELKRLD